jgi:cob(I)alamin adenosyltransferase
MKIYTKTGDNGTTSLIGGSRVSKSCIEINAIGEIDELNAAVGIVITTINEKKFRDTAERLSVVQHRLFTVGSNVADVQLELGHVPKIMDSDITSLEVWIDEMEHELDPITQFILPGGSLAAANVFYARAICRRAERRLVEVKSNYPALDPRVLQYVNRLSDTLFVLARWLNAKQEIEDVVWVK